LSVIALLWLTPPLCSQTTIEPPAESLPTNTLIERNIKGDDKHPYEVALNSEEVLQVRVSSIGVDVRLRLLDASSQEVALMRSPPRNQSEVTLTFVAPVTGSYRLEVTTLNAKDAPGKYTIRREPSRTATAQDRRRVEVERIFVEGLTARAINGQEGVAIQKFTEALAGWRALADVSMANLANRLLLNTKAKVAFFEGRVLVEKNQAAASRAAIEKFEEARGFYHQIGETTNEATAIVGMSQAVMDLKDERAAIEFLKQAYPLFATPGEKPVKSDLLAEIVKYYVRTGETNAALEHALLLYPIYVDLSRQRDAAVIANTIGALYFTLGDNEKAFEFLNKALLLRNFLGDTCSEVEVLTNLGAVYLALGRKAEALRFLRDEALPLYEKGGACGIYNFRARNNLGNAYFDLGEFEMARTHYLKAFEGTNENGLKAILKNNLGEVHYAMGEYQVSLGYFLEALALYKGDTKTQATTLTNVGVVHSALGHDRLAIATLNKAMKLRQAVGDRNGEAITLTSLSEIYLKLNQKTVAMERSNQALTLFGAVSDPNGEAFALANAMNVSRALGNRRLAIFYGKRSVNKFQELRGAARGIEGELQKNYLRTVKGAYQQLAELLVEEGLFEQAIQVLNLYQDQQFFDFDLDLNAPVRQAYLSASEDRLAKRLEMEGAKLKRLETQIAELKRQISIRQSIIPEAGKLQPLQTEFMAAADAFASVLKNAPNELMKPADGWDKRPGVEDIAELQKALGKPGAAPGQKAVLLYTLAGKENFYVLLMSPEGIKAFSHPSTAVAMSKKVKAFLEVLSCPDFDPFQESAALYNIIFKSVSTDDKQTTLEAELGKRAPALLLWTLGDPLDSVPMSALYDGRRKQFLVERYQLAVFTRARPDSISREPKPWLNGIGLGTSKAYTGYDALPGVKKSLPVIFDDLSSQHKGIIHGPALIDEQFTRSVMENLNGRWPLVHIASHFDYFAGNADKSVLLLGNGDKFSLTEMQKHKTLFAGVELLTLSACKTSVKQTNIYGKEIDGFAELAQRLGANSVIATLWNVDDDYAPGREIEFYRLYRDHQDWAKAEILRQSQLGLLNGKITLEPESRPAGKRIEREGCVAASDNPHKRYTPSPKAPLAHPYYWAPFVLYGGSR
jgi:CHAT domain-containing protein/tetratricopeptide (TPR) repeat protein